MAELATSQEQHIWSCTAGSLRWGAIFKVKYSHFEGFSTGVVWEMDGFVGVGRKRRVGEGRHGGIDWHRGREKRKSGLPGTAGMTEDRMLM